MRPPTLRHVGIAGAVLGVAGLFAPMFWSSLWPEPVATIDSPATNAWVPRCFVARGTVDPGTIRRPLWLMKADSGGRWREVGRVYPAPGTWGSRICADDRDTSEVRLALVLADDALDAKLSGPPKQEPDVEVIPEWLKRSNCGEQQGGCGRHRYSFPSLPVGSTPVAPVVTVNIVGASARLAYLASKGPLYFPPALETGRSVRRHAVGAHRSKSR